MATLRCAALGLAALLMAAPGWSQSPVPRGADKVALVIGNNSYPQAGLRNAVNDAKAVATTLRDLGFEVSYRENLALAPMLDAMREFLLQAAGSQVRVFYYAGHGAQWKGRNYLVPVDAFFRNEDEVATRAANASELVERLGQSRSGVNVVILDACRNSAFPVGTRTRGPGGNARSLAPGLAQVVAPRGTLVSFSTAPGAVALDGSDGNSAFTRHLVSNMRVPGLPVEQLFKRVRIGVAADTAQAQVPWESSSLMGEFCFRPGPDGRCGGAEMLPAADLPAKVAGGRR